MSPLRCTIEGAFQHTRPQHRPKSPARLNRTCINASGFPTGFIIRHTAGAQGRPKSPRQMQGDLGPRWYRAIWSEGPRISINPTGSPEDILEKSRAALWANEPRNGSPLASDRTRDADNIARYHRGKSDGRFWANRVKPTRSAIPKIVRSHLSRSHRACWKFFTTPAVESVCAQCSVLG